MTGPSSRDVARRRRETVAQQRGDVALRLAYDECEEGVLVLAVLLSLGLVERGCWPSLAEMGERAGLGRRAVRGRLGCLVDAGIIADTGARRGRTKQIVVWGLGPEVLSTRSVPPARSEGHSYPAPSERGPWPLPDDRPPPDWATDPAARVDREARTSDG